MRSSWRRPRSSARASPARDPAMSALASAGAPPASVPGTGLRTEFAFILPRGFVDGAGNVHRDGVMRLATAKDEIIPQRDPRVRENEAYLTVLLLSRVITRLGGLSDVHAGIIENMFASDLAFLQDLYRRVNQEGSSQAAVACPSCKHEFTVDIAAGRLGGS